MLVYDDLYIVGLGASAGGFEALQKFLRNIQSDERITYVITQHLDPNQPTMLGTLLTRYTNLELIVVEDGMQPKGNTIYVCPQNKDLTIVNGCFHIETPQHVRISPKPSINKFFESLAIEKKEKAIGVVLSGTGNDGAEGIVAIKNNGGITLAEDEGAKYFSMQKAAIDTGKVDAVLPPELLSEGMKYIIVDRNYFDKHFEVQDSMGKIYDILNRKTDVDFSSYKENTILRRITKRMNETKCLTIDDYINYLNTDINEIDKLRDELLIIVTSFFRDKESFIELKKQLTTSISNSVNSVIRIWIPACATGEEPYSMAIIIAEIFRELNINKKVTIFATDISEKAVNTARTNIFSKEELYTLDPTLVDRYFDKDKNGYRPNKIIRDSILFSKHDIIKDPPFSNLDMVSCRNLLIYFNSELQRRILNIFYYALKYNGLLFLGQSETVTSNTSLYSIVSNKHKIYKKTNDLGDIDIEKISYRKNPSFIRLNSKNNQQSLSINDVELVLAKTVSENFAQNGVIIDSSTNIILFYRGDCGLYFNHPKGLASNDLFKLINDDLKLDLRATLNEARKNEKVAKSKKIRMLSIEEKKIYTTITVFPLPENKLGDNTFYVLFENEENLEWFHTTQSTNLDSNEINILEDELMILKEKLQITIEELETSNEELQSTNEELQSTNEELQSTNEELQSTNEELETSNEELHSTNEELQTVNDELTYKNFELEFANNAFNSVLGILNAHAIIMDSHLNIIKYTEGISQFFTIDKTTTNFSTFIMHSKVSLPNILEDLRDCLERNAKVEYEISVDDRIYWFSVKRIKVSVDIYNKDIGLVLSFTDKTDMVKKDKLLSQQAKMAAIGEMLGNIAHQWRQPLNNLSALIIALSMKHEKKGIDKSDMIDFESKANTFIQKMSSTIDDFKNFFLPNKQKINLEISKVLDEAIYIVNESYKSYGISIEIHNEINPFVNIYKNELEQVFINLLNNAKDAIVLTKPPKGKVEIKVETQEDNICITIEDNGGGIDDNLLEKIFEPYFTTKFKDEGTGIGLYMSKMIIEQSMKGTLTIQNHNLGVLCKISLPINEGGGILDNA